MTADEIITEYESSWRAMALAGTPQFYGCAAGGIAGGDWAEACCAWLVMDRELEDAAQHEIREWRCPETRCTYVAATMANAMIHINNRHHWSFERFAKDFREAWQKGIA